MDDLTKVFLATALDTEGTIGLKLAIDRRTEKSPTVGVVPYITVANTSEEWIKIIHRHIKGALHIIHKPTRKTKTVYAVSLTNRKEVEGLLKTLSGYFIIKRAQVETMLAYFAECPYNTSCNKKRLEYHERMKHLNRRGRE